jgi:hypothetical protein
LKISSGKVQEVAVTPKLTTKAACRVADIDRDRFNEHVAAGHYRCAPRTIPGRARLFDPDDMVGLWLFRELMSDGFNAERAGAIACEVARAARVYPDVHTITYVSDYFQPFGGKAFPSEHVPSPAEWQKKDFSGTNIRKTMTFNIAHTRKILAHRTEEERSIIGEDD